MLLLVSIVHSQDSLSTKIVLPSTFNAEQGLALNRIEDAVFDSEGFLWVLSANGLQFWDGSEFANSIDTMACGNQDCYLRPHPSKGIYIINGDKMYYKLRVHEKMNLFYEFEDKLRNGASVSLDKKRMLLADGNRLMQFEFSTARLDTIEEDAQAKSTHHYVTEYNVDGEEWMLFHNCKQISQRRYANEFSNINIKRFGSCVIDLASIALNSDALVLYTNDGASVYSFPKNIKALYYKSVRLYRDSLLLVGIDDRLFSFNWKKRQWISEFRDSNQKNPFEAKYIDKILIDRFDNIWIVNVTDGLTKLKVRDAFTYYGSDKLENNFVKSFACNLSNKEVLSIGLKRELALYSPDGQLKSLFDLSNQLASNTSITGVYYLNKTSFLLVVNRDVNLYIFDTNDPNQALQVIGQRENEYIYYQSAERVGSKLILGLDEVYVLDVQPTKVQQLTNGVGSIYSSTVLGSLYFGSNDRITKFDLNTQQIDSIELAGFGYVRDIIGASEDLFYVAGNKGTFTYNRQTNALTNIYPHCTYSMQLDQEDKLWLGTDRGLVFLDHSGRMQTYKKDEGIQGAEFNTNASFKSSDGQLYFGGSQGITSFYPSKIPSDNSSSQLYIKSIKIDNVVFDEYTFFDQIDEIELAYNNNNVQVQLGVLGQSIVKEYHFFDRINSDNTFTNHENNNLFSYTLAPGKYSIEYQVSPLDADKITTLNITIRQPWWASKMFYFISFISLLSIVGLLIYLSYKRKLLKAKMAWDAKYMLQEEKMKLSRDLHDSIGSQLTYLVSSIENIRMDPDRKEQEENLDKLSQYSKSIIEELRSMIWVLHKDDVRFEELGLKISDLLGKVSNPDLTINFNQNYDKEQVIPAKVAGDLFRVIQELLHNTFKHADASEIVLNIAADIESVALIYFDNGKGFDPGKMSDGFGLRNIRKRVEGHKGTLVFAKIEKNQVRTQIEIPLNT